MREEARNLHDAAQRLIAAEKWRIKKVQCAKEPFRSESAAPFATTDWPPQPTGSSAASDPALSDADADVAVSPTRARSGGSACSSSALRWRKRGAVRRLQAGRHAQMNRTICGGSAGRRQFAAFSFGQSSGVNGGLGGHCGGIGSGGAGVGQIREGQPRRTAAASRRCPGARLAAAACSRVARRTAPRAPRSSPAAEADGAQPVGSR